jgi:ATP-binding cassette subfamily C (CFTR/MRP) protein 4
MARQIKWSNVDTRRAANKFFLKKDKSHYCHLNKNNDSSLMVGWVWSVLQSVRKNKHFCDDVPEISPLVLTSWPKNLLIASFFGMDKRIFLLNFGILFLSSALLVCNQYVVFGAFLGYLGDKTQRLWYGWMTASVFFAVQLIVIAFGVWSGDVASVRSIRHSRALTLKASHVLIGSALGAKASVSQICNAVIPRIVFSADDVLALIIAIIMVTALTAILYLFLGWIMFALLGLIALSQLAIIPMGAAEGRILEKLYENSRKRILMVEEVVVSVFHMKIQGLQRNLLNRIFDARSEELWSYVRYFTMPGDFPNFVSTFGGDLLLYGVTFGTGGIIDLANLFVSFPLISILQGEAGKVSSFLYQFGMYKVASGTFEEFTKTEMTQVHKGDDLPSCSSVVAKNCSFEVDEKFSVKNVFFSVQAGQWLFVCGGSGSGKSTLLLGLLGERKLKSGDLSMSGSVAFAAQTPWLIEGTIRSNVVFGRQFEEERFWNVISAAGLVQDLSELQGKDLFKVSEGGSNFSGGQRQRISLARTLYANTTIMLFDDCLSALDAKVKNFVFEKLQLICKTQCVIFSTKEESIAFDGVSILESGYFSLLRQPVRETVLVPEEGKADVFQAEALISISKPTPNETMRVDTPMRQWVAYVQNAGFFFAFFVIARFAAEAVSAFARFWVTLWLQGYWNFSALLWSLYFIAIFGGATLIFFFGELTRAGFAVSAAKRIHEKSISGIVKTKMNFFDTNQPKNVCSRFSNDVRTLDEVFPVTFSVFAALVVSFLSVIGVMAYIFPVSLAGFPIVAFGSLLVYKQVVNESLVLQKVQTNVLANTVSLMNTGYAGRVFFRVFRKADAFLRCFESQQIFESSTVFATRMFQVWTAAALQLLVAFYFYGASILALFLGGDFGGLFLVYGLQLGNSVTLMVRSALLCQRTFIGISRVFEYSELEPESLSTLEPPPNWPSEGNVELSNVSFSYAEHLPLVLKNVSIAFRSGTSSGVVGRTGAGKSSVFLSLFAMYKISGCASIDGFDVKLFDPDSMRFRLSFVPQEPIFFEGSIRQNLDPDGVISSAEINEVLDRVGFQSANLEESVPENRGDAQKLSLVRGVVKKSRVICIDEGAAALEKETNDKVTNLLLELPGTKIMIAHQLESVMKCDQIVVLDKGRVVEIDQPKALVNKDSVFKALVQAGGLESGKNLENLAREKREIIGCFICRKSFSKLQTKVECKSCSQFVCSWCSEYCMCMYCWTKAEKEKDFAFVIHGAKRQSEKMALPCKNCSLPFTQECCKCHNFYCSRCVIHFRDIWGTKTSQVCRSCWPILKDEFKSEANNESNAETFQGDNLPSFEIECAVGTCLICRKKGVNQKCHGCSSFVCGICSGFVHAPEISRFCLSLLCSKCLQVKLTKRQLFGEPCGFLALTESQAKMIEENKTCSVCSSTVHFFQQPYLCRQCESVVCRKCFSNDVCENCQQGRTTKVSVEVLICDECKEVCPVINIVWLNDRRFHPECVINYRKKGGLFCAFCNQLALQSQGTCIFNGQTVHNSCLVPFKKQQAQMM